MIAFGHSAVGVIVGTTAIALISPQIPPVLQLLMVFIVAVVIHYAMDFLPHGHYYIDPKKPNIKSLVTLVLDLIGGVVLFSLMAAVKYSVTSLEFWLILVAMAGSQLPDVIEALTRLNIIPKLAWVSGHTVFHSKMHWHNEPDSPLPGGARPIRISDIWQLFTICLAVFLLIKS